MIEIFYRYRVHPSQARAFEHAYGSTGPWAALFKKHPGYRRTRLFRHKTQGRIYLTADIWDDKPSWDEFRRIFVDEYLILEKQLSMLHLEEHLLGFYDGTQEGATRIDALA